MRISLLVVLLLVAPACARSRCGPCAAPSLPAACARTGPPAQARAATWIEVAPTPAVPPGVRLYETEDASPLSLRALVARAASVDVVAFGELHGHLDGAALQLRLLEALAATGRPLVLALEFFERDTQPALEAYLAGEIDQATLMERGRQSKAFLTTHGPLLDLCKARGFPVVAANAPRPLVTTYRKSDLDYPAYLEGLSEAERSWLPTTTSTPDDAYFARFISFMGEERGPRFFRAQALWDDAMAESVARARVKHPQHRVVLVVGAFHVTGGLGTLTKLGERRPDDRVLPLVMTTSEDPSLPLPGEARLLAPVVAVVRPLAALRAEAKAEAESANETTPSADASNASP